MTRRLVLAVAMIAAALAGCVSVLPKATPVQLYRFGGGEEAAAAPAVAPAAGARSLALGAVTLPRAAAGDGLLTVTGDEAAYVAGARWVSPAAILLREAAARARALAARPGLRLTPPDAPADARLDLAVADFQAEYAAPGSAPAVRLALVATLTPRGAPPRTRAFAVSRPAGANRLSAIVPAYDAAVRDVLDQLAAWTEAQTPPPS